jgi:hypothetical protein
MKYKNIKQMKKVILVLIVSLFVVGVYSQDSAQNENKEWKPSQSRHTNFDIGKYITPDIVRNRLDIDLYLNSSYLRSDNSSDSHNDLFKTSDFTGNIQSDFSRYVNTRKRISHLAGRLSFAQDHNSETYERTFTNDSPTIINNMSKSFQRNSLNLGWLNKWYFSESIFMDYGASSNVAYSFTRDKTKNQSEDSNEKRNIFSFNFSPKIGIGYGRIENVEDARQAIYIADALSKRNVLTRNLSNEELLALSQKISTVKNKRFLDSRLHLMDEIAAVDSFFVKNNLLADNGASYFTTLYDMWHHGALFSRRSGYEVSFVVRPYYFHQNSETTHVTQKNIWNVSELAAYLNFNYEKPFKLNWQHSVDARAIGSIHSQRSEQTGNDEYTDRTDGKIFTAFASYYLGYYPNTRTNIQVGALQRVSRNIIDEQGRFTNYDTILSAKLYYYFSPHFRLAGDCGLRYAPSRYKWDSGGSSGRNIFSSLFNVSLTYHIF